MSIYHAEQLFKLSKINECENCKILILHGFTITNYHFVYLEWRTSLTLIVQLSPQRILKYSVNLNNFSCIKHYTILTFLFEIWYIIRIQFILNVKIYDENKLLWYKTWVEFILYLSIVNYSKTPKIRQKSLAQSQIILNIFILYFQNELRVLSKGAINVIFPF